MMFLLGLITLMAGAEILVRAAARLGIVAGISPLVVGITIVGFGTSSPELAIGLKAALTNHPDIIVGAVIGSTIFNIFFILGLSALINPLVVPQQLIWFEVPIMLGAHFLLLAMIQDGIINTKDALFLFICMIVFILYVLYRSFKDKNNKKEAMNNQFIALPQSRGAQAFLIAKLLLMIVAGLFLCALGADWLLESTVVLARTLGISELVIGITLVAASTSLPELATSVVAALRGQRDIAIGNVIGSNIFNVFGILGVVGLAAPHGILIAPSISRLDLPVAITACVACLPIFFTGHKISRWEGMVFLSYYVAYISYLIMAASNHDTLPMFSTVMLGFVIPLTFITLVILTCRGIRGQ